ncbi:hypothetical protein [Actinokineospora terrae]|uniref:Protein kinase domain-containing protein n=1 Tax=Actinokineospora terrae TaxID=155974 RepID=A0A1H9MZY9_9PSEU|nr:hypothetical protein [Actinokineospora terrae]SER29296.1 hypothetical protein SAMN04487818_102434 [Actinokineospora terrae]
MNDVPEVDARALGRLRLLGTGGQGKVLRLLDHADGPDAVVYKEYSPRVVDDVDVDALRNFVGFAHGLAPGVRAKLLATTAWPEAVVRKDGVVVGFLMRKAPAAYTAAMRFGEETSTEPALVQFLLNPPEYLAARGLRLSPRFRYEFLHDTATALDLLHGLGVGVGDLSPNNMLFSLTARPRVFFLDCDAMRLAGESVLPQVETPDWRISDVGPEELATPGSDTYKLGLLAVRLFANDQQSSDPRRVPIRLRAKVTASLRRDPDKRPSARSWIDALATAARDATDTSDTPEPKPSPPPPEPDDEVVEQPPARQRPRVGVAGAVVLAVVALGVITMLNQAFPAKQPRDPSLGLTTLGVSTPGYDIYRSVLAPPTGGARIPTAGLPGAATPLTGLPGIGLPDSPLRPTYWPSNRPTFLLDPEDFLVCRPIVRADQGVRGGAGLDLAKIAVGTVVCEINAATRTRITRIGLESLTDQGPVSAPRVVGFWGEGTSSPRVVAALTTKSGGCVRVSLQLTAAYKVSAAGVAGTC